MRKIVKRRLLTVSLMLTMVSLPGYAKTITLQELQDLKYSNTQVSAGKSFNNNHWAYKSLENITKKYGLLVGKPGEQFDGNKPLTRNEAAVILVNLTGRIEQDKVELTEAEKTQVDILRQELGGEIQTLAGRVATLEESVDTLKGSVANLEESDKNSWQHSFGENFKINGTFQARYSGVTRKGSTVYPSNFRIPLAEFALSGKLHPHINYVIGLKPERTFTSSSKGLLGDAYVVTDILPHHNIYLGQTRVPIGIEGTVSSSALDTIERAQIARNFSDIRDLGVKAAGNWSFIDYSAGFYNGDGQNTNDGDNNLSVATWAVVKPLYKLPQLGKLELGGGYNTGRKTTYDFDVLSAYAGYKYKKYAIRGELASASGYNLASRKADGWYVHNTYDLTKKIQLVARLDQFDPNSKIAKDDIYEYTLGSNYYLSGQNLKMQLNLVHIDNKSGQDSQRIGVQTQYKF